MAATEAPDGMYVQLPVVEVHNKMVHGTTAQVMVPLAALGDLGATLDDPDDVMGDAAEDGTPVDGSFQ